MVLRERLDYKKKKYRAILTPTQYFSSIIYGSDQSSIGLPQFITKTKDMRGHTLNIRLSGVLENTHPNKLRLYTPTEEFATGTNHFVEAINRFLSNLFQKLVLPKNLYIPLDNTSREI